MLEIINSADIEDDEDEYASDESWPQEVCISARTLEWSGDFPYNEVCRYKNHGFWYRVGVDGLTGIPDLNAMGITHTDWLRH